MIYRSKSCIRCQLKPCIRHICVESRGQQGFVASVVLGLQEALLSGLVTGEDDGDVL